MIPDELVWRMKAHRWKFNARSGKDGAFGANSDRVISRDPYFRVAYDGISHLQPDAIRNDDEAATVNQWKKTLLSAYTKLAYHRPSIAYSYWGGIVLSGVRLCPTLFVWLLNLCRLKSHFKSRKFFPHFSRPAKRFLVPEHREKWSYDSCILCKLHPLKVDVAALCCFCYLSFLLPSTHIWYILLCNYSDY